LQHRWGKVVVVARRHFPAGRSFERSRGFEDGSIQRVAHVAADRRRRQDQKNVRRVTTFQITGGGLRWCGSLSVDAACGQENQRAEAQDREFFGHRVTVRVLSAFIGVALKTISSPNGAGYVSPG